jgi:pimeloyl-ACP methyl ester carboxylesterase
MAAVHAVARGGVRRLVLVDALGLAPFAPTAEFGVALHAYLASPDERSFDHLMGYCMHDIERLRRRAGEAWAPFVAYTLELVRDAERREALAALMERFGFPAISPETLARITVPVVLIWGRQDLATNVAVAEAASTRYGWPLHIIDDCADDPVMEQPEHFVETLTRLPDAAPGHRPA